MTQQLIDEFVVWKGHTPYTGNYDVPTEEESSSAIVKSAEKWAADTAWSVGDTIITSSGFVYVVEQAGTSGTSDPQWGDAQVSDGGMGGVIWKLYADMSKTEQVWEASFEYGEAIYIKVGGYTYCSPDGGVSGIIEPTWGYPVIVDGTVTWYLIDDTVESTDEVQTQEEPAIVEEQAIAINTGDFCIDLEAKILASSNWSAQSVDRNNPILIQRIYVIGQWEHQLAGYSGYLYVYWQLYIDCYNDSKVRAMFRFSGLNGVRYQVEHNIDIDNTYWVSDGNKKRGTIRLTVSRHGDEMRIFVNGLYSDAIDMSSFGDLWGNTQTSPYNRPSSYRICRDIEAITGEIQINGHYFPCFDGTKAYPSMLPKSEIFRRVLPIETIEILNVRIFDFAYYWDDFALSIIPWWQLPGIAISTMIG